ncbi:DUF554 domain-containing protein [Clostridium sp.]|jgi:uncharacterized membrane protein YqgA involved in biofilm formation|uniref:DUF554 domain-containing protein n=1 Tax=Clostridium sp. TaxID=1506 RepID=UPI0025872E56|nr:DUF554 domain-containing protein [Clostridium sp.]MDF2505295.1 hypothetical protein [Clostridium sp.]
MPIGVIVNALSVFIGGLIGAFLGDKIPERVRKALPLTFGVASMAMGISLIMKMDTMPAVILSLILGSAIGELIKLEKGIEWCAGRIRKPIERIFPSKGDTDNQKDFIEKFVGIVVLFCASGTGIFGALNEGMTGDHSVLLAKSFLDFFTAGIFATALGYIVLTICIPQFIILICLFLSASLILPMTTPTMVADFTACGGIIMLATGFRISGIKAFPIANMLPALVIVMPISHLWVSLVK